MLGLFKKKSKKSAPVPHVEPPKERKVGECGQVLEKHILPEFGEVWVIVDDAEDAQ